MDGGFTELIRDWQGFYATLATASATLVGLLFVAVTLNAGSLLRGSSRWQLRIARKAFGDFTLVLMSSVVFLVPRLPPIGFSVALLALGIAVTFGVSRAAVVSLRDGDSPGLWHTVRAFALSLAGSLGLIAASVLIYLGYPDALYWLVCVWAALIASACATAWSLLTSVPGRGRRAQ